MFTEFQNNFHILGGLENVLDGCLRGWNGHDPKWLTVNFNMEFLGTPERFKILFMTENEFLYEFPMQKTCSC